MKKFKRLFFILWLSLSQSAVIAQSETLTVSDLIRIGSNIKSYESVIDGYSRSSITPGNALHWRFATTQIWDASECYKFAALEYEIYTRKINIDLRDFRYGPKLVNKNNEEEVVGNIYLCYLKGIGLAKIFDNYDSLAMVEVANNGQKIADLQKPVLYFLTPYIEKYQKK